MARKGASAKAKSVTKTSVKHVANRVAERAPDAGKRVRKNMDMDQSKLDKAKRFFGARTETEAVDAALDLAAFQSEVAAGIDRMMSAGGIADIFDE